MLAFVTGATGFVGSHVARQLVAAGDAVRVLVRRSTLEDVFLRLTGRTLID